MNGEIQFSMEEIQSERTRNKEKHIIKYGKVYKLKKHLKKAEIWFITD